MKQPVKELFTLTGDESTPAADGRLSISVSDTHVSYAISNAAGDTLYSLKWFSLPELTVEALDTLRQSNSAFSGSYHHIHIAYLYPQTLLTPAADVSAASGGRLLNLVHGKPDTDVVLDEVLAGGHIRQVYSVPKDVHEWLQQYFPQAVFHHGYALFVNRMIDATENGILAVDFRNEEWSVVAGASGKPLLAQTFPYHTPADVLFYLLKICQELGLKQDSVQLQLSGLVAEKSALYKELSQYFRELAFHEATWGSIGNGETPSHFFTSLNELSLCGS
ncbi:DUF3822 family protein [Terrimonas ferruginea]|uniref:DUF3822 family protein n=1 Tax=Terrimonas ferruginea TaxID=249 RepID=UPI00048B5BC7|nr:DUF3822 family protein [Terrimonas ferruginea]